MNHPNTPSSSAGHYIAVFVEPKRLSETGQTIKKLRTEIHHKLATAGLLGPNAMDLGIGHPTTIGFRVADLDKGLLEVQAGLATMGIEDGEIGHWDGEVWRTFWPPSSKPFARHYSIADVGLAKRFNQWLGLSICVASIAALILLAVNWRRSPWIAISAFSLLSVFLVRGLCNAWRKVRAMTK